MAIDTRDKRATAGRTFVGVSPDGDVDKRDRGAVARVYVVTDFETADPPPTESQLVLRSTLNVITSAAQLIVPAHQYAYARVTNKTGVTIYVGGMDVSTSNGFPILNNGSEQFELRMTDALYAIAASGSNNLNVLVQIH